MRDTIITISIPLFIFSIVVLAILAGRVREMKPHKRRTTFYALVAGIGFALSCFFFFTLNLISWIAIFVFLVLFFTGLGIAHHYVGRIILPWTRKAHIFWLFLYSLVIAALGSIGYMWGYYLLAGKEAPFNYAFLIAGTFFLIPPFVYHSFKAFHVIPKKEFKKWYYPIGQAIDDPTDRELEAPFVISFEFEKKFDDINVTSFRAKAPRYMKFGRLFYFFINDYNSRHPESKIEYVYDKSKPYGWVFYRKPNWYESLTYINADETIADNKIEENSVIVCRRIMD